MTAQRVCTRIAALGLATAAAPHAGAACPDPFKHLTRSDSNAIALQGDEGAVPDGIAVEFHLESPFAG